MVREINMGVSCGSVKYEIVIANHSQYVTYIIETSPALYTGTLTDFCVAINDSGAGGTLTWGTYRKDINGKFTRISYSGTANISAGLTNVIAAISGQSVAVTAGDYIGICFVNTNSEDPITVPYTVISGKYSYTLSSTPCTSTDTALTYGQNSVSYIRIIAATGWEPTAGNAPDACQNSGQFTGTYTGWGIAAITGTDCSVPPYQVSLHVTTPWGEYIPFEVFGVGQTRTYLKSGSAPKEYWSVYVTFVSCLNNSVELTECWWRESDIYYVKNGGNDNSLGVSWSTAFATITKAATKVPANGKVYIGFGTYNSETNITPTALGANPIRYSPCTPDSSGGTGSVIINL